MIKRIYETHLQAKDIEKSIHFYQDLLGLSLGLGENSSNAVFFWAVKEEL